MGGPILGSLAQITLGNIALGKSRGGFVEGRDGTGRGAGKRDEEEGGSEYAGELHSCCFGKDCVYETALPLEECAGY